MNLSTAVQKNVDGEGQGGGDIHTNNDVIVGDARLDMGTNADGDEFENNK